MNVSRDGSVPWWFLAGLVVCGAWMLADHAVREPEAQPAPQQPDPSVLSAAPLRPQAGRPTYRTGVEAFQCRQCHVRYISPVDDGRRRLVAEHRGLRLVHGTTDSCYACHAREDRDKLVGPQGRPVAFSEAHLACGTCHGERLRDWKLGLHGRQNGGWNPSLSGAPPAVRQVCTACHDPHAPAIKGVRPQPGPSYNDHRYATTTGTGGATHE